MLLPLLLSATLITSALASYDDIVSRAEGNPDPAAAGSTDGGWQTFPDIPDAQKYTDWIVDEDLGAQIPLYQTSGLNNSAVKRAVIILPGKPRDCWYYWNVMNNALYYAVGNNTGVKREEVSIMGPCFFDANDLTAGVATSNQLVWGDTTWISGHSNIGPSNISDYSSYDALDALISYYLDRDAYPNLNVVMVAGHSAGAQMSQRYLGLRKSSKHDDRLHFWIANPGSIMWLVEDRPLPNTTCTGFDEYKYGLGGSFPAYATHDANKLGRDGLVERYRERQAHYAWGLMDDGAGDTRCEAETQGWSHLTRGQNFVYMLGNMTDGVPTNTTVDWVPNASHDNVEMMTSTEGMNKLFAFNYNTTSADKGTNGKSSSSSSSSDDSSGGSSSSSGKNGASSLSAAWGLSASGLFLLLALAHC